MEPRGVARDCVGCALQGRDEVFDRSSAGEEADQARGDCGQDPRQAPDTRMIILFGSHARGDWVEDMETGYRSDWDLRA